MHFVMSLCTIVILFGAIIMMLGLMWTMIDGRLWDNPGEIMLHWGMGICGVSFFFMLVALFYFAVQCTFSTTCHL